MSLLSLPTGSGCHSAGQPRKRSSAIGWASIVLLVAVVTASCSGPSPKTSPSTTAPKVESTTRPDPVGQDVVAAYRRYWDVFIAVASELNLPDPRLAEVATGEALKALNSSFLASKAAGEEIRGTIDLAPKVTAVEGDHATVSDCYASRIFGYDAASGQPKGPERPGRTLVTVTLVKEGTTWKVAAIRHEGEGCNPAS